MKYGLLLITLCITATALTSGEYSSAYMAVGLDTTTHNPKTTTHSPNTTTPSPNTTTHNPNTTTSRPKTTVTTPIPSPTPPTNMAVGHYNFSKDGKVCIMVEMAIGIRVNTSKVNGTFIVQQNKTTVSGECGDKASTIRIIFSEGQFTLKFRNNETIKKFYVEYMDYDLTYAFKTGESNDYSGKNDSLELFSVEPGHSYSCQAETVYMGDGVSLDLTHNKFQAFDFKNNEFGPPEVCKADQHDYRVAIVVGIILIILIVIVVMAYLISRKRRSDGYQSL
ncbi:macrosialin isoform X1 [Sinocyclocheilus anshuiensis]|uniref:macrosialin isoform X1 n=2 Tax=Sinocyclocheilus anshuiensis TaxID=1608454 RepID=UPI0007B96D7C|nr:PREDICTED: macrosialin-like isoform X1 [Sinocyclocheilus anshuiensis]